VTREWLNGCPVNVRIIDVFPTPVSPINNTLYVTWAPDAVDDDDIRDEEVVVVDDDDVDVRAILSSSPDRLTARLIWRHSSVALETSTCSDAAAESVVKCVTET